MSSRYPIFIPFLLVLCVLTLTACGRTEVEIPFETIDSNQYGGYTDQNPGIKIITSPEQVNELKKSIDSKATESLLKLDYSRYVGIALFHGVRSVGPYAVTVDHVKYDGQNVYIYSTFSEPDEIETMAVTSPYQVITIKRPPDSENNWRTTFILYNKEQEVARRAVTLSGTFVSPVSPFDDKKEGK